MKQLEAPQLILIGRHHIPRVQAVALPATNDAKEPVVVVGCEVNELRGNALDAHLGAGGEERVTGEQVEGGSNRGG